MGMQSVRSRLHTKNPYGGLFVKEDKGYNVFGWNKRERFYRDIVKDVRPDRIIEVGTWLGASAVTLADEARGAGLDSELICVDTWLGSEEHWYPGRELGGAVAYDALRLRNGYPSLYFEFLANVIRNGLQDVITPFPIHSEAAAVWFANNDVKADLIFLDASHSYESVTRDVRNYYPLLSERGVLFGDDHAGYWTSVIDAVGAFAAGLGARLSLSEEKWVLRKTALAPLALQADPLRDVSPAADGLRIDPQAASGLIEVGEESPEGYLHVKGWARVGLTGGRVAGVLVVGANSRYVILPSHPREDLPDHNGDLLGFWVDLPLRYIHAEGAGIRFYAYTDDGRATPLAWSVPNSLSPALAFDRTAGTVQAKSGKTWRWNRDESQSWPWKVGAEGETRTLTGPWPSVRGAPAVAVVAFFHDTVVAYREFSGHQLGATLPIMPEFAEAGLTVVILGNGGTFATIDIRPF